MSDSPELPASNFPKNVEDFDADTRVSFSKLDNKFILETDAGQEYEFDEKLKRWVPVVRPPPMTIEDAFRARIARCSTWSLKPDYRGLNT